MGRVTIIIVRFFYCCKALTPLQQLNNFVYLRHPARKKHTQHKYGKEFKVCPQFERKCASTHAGKKKLKNSKNVLLHQIIDQTQTDSREF